MFQKPPGPVRGRDHYLGLIADENVGLFVAESGESILGFAHAAIRETPDIPLFVPRRYAVLIDLVVRSGYQKRGIGRTLVDKAQAWAIAQRVTSIELNVFEFNENAISFYEKLGYRTLSRKMSKDLE
jgi:ribosomal protein S18 acetylase RimI-like enzyme